MRRADGTWPLQRRPTRPRGRDNGAERDNAVQRTASGTVTYSRAQAIGAKVRETPESAHEHDTQHRTDHRAYRRRTDSSRTAIIELHRRDLFDRYRIARTVRYRESPSSLVHARIADRPFWAVSA